MKTRKKEMKKEEEKEREKEERRGRRREGGGAGGGEQNVSLFSFWNSDSQLSRASSALSSGMFLEAKIASFPFCRLPLRVPPACRCLLVSRLLPHGARSRARLGETGAPSARVLGPSEGNSALRPFARRLRSLRRHHPAPGPSLHMKLVPAPAPGAAQPDGRGSKTKVTLLAECVFPGRSYFCCGCELKSSPLDSPSLGELWNVNLFQSSVF